MNAVPILFMPLDRPPGYSAKDPSTGCDVVAKSCRVAFASTRPARKGNASRSGAAEQNSTTR